MTVRRRAARLATVCGLLGGLVMLGATPALADDDSVRVGAASSFAAGGSAQGVNVAVRKRSDGCVIPRTALNLRLDGLQSNQVAVQVAVGGHWVPAGVSGGGGSVTVGWTSSTKPLCKGKGTTVRYRVAFAAGAPGGRLVVTGEVAGMNGQSLGRATDTSKVTGGVVSASPTPTRSKKPTPTPSPVVTEADTATDVVDPAALGDVSASPAAAAADESSSGASPVMFFGIAMVAVGLLLIVLLLRRSRQDRSPADEPRGPLPGNPGGTTYRSGGGSPAAPTQPGPVYGQQPPTGGYGAVPTPRPAAGGVYGARPSVPTSTPDATQPMPGAPVTRPAPGDPPPAAAGDDHTVFMPRLPG
ncbi:hypothetical protein V6V47_09330 [Micromonospora sp. CPCC 205539]|uniref:hypothetical protein n=1 Tax=Micromonospora sp. CPCC 205539 TaxID=3122408 RepID=UPI002FF07114